MTSYDVWDLLRLFTAILALGLAWLPEWITWDPDDESRADPSYVRGALVRSLTWPIGAYGCMGIVELFFDSTDLHADQESLFAFALLLTLVLAPAVIALAWKLAGPSGGGHRLFLGAVRVLILSVPLASVQILSDVNRHLDTSPETVVTRTVVKKVTTAGKYGSHRRLYFSPSDASHRLKLPDSLEVGEANFLRAHEGGHVDIALGQGRLGFTWYRKVVVS